MSATITLATGEDRRLWKALTKCAGGDDDRPSLGQVMLDGSLAYATDTRVLGVLEADVDLPIDPLPDDEGAMVIRDRVVLDSKLLRDALGLVKGKTLARLRFEDRGAVLVIGDDPLPLGDGFAAPEVRIPYGDATNYPPTERLHAMLYGPNTAVADAELGQVMRLGLNATNLARVGALATQADVDDALVTVVPRGSDPSSPLEVYDANNGRLLGVMARIRELHDLARTFSVTIDGSTFDTDSAGDAAAAIVGDARAKLGAEDDRHDPDDKAAAKAFLAALVDGDGRAACPRCLKSLKPYVATTKPYGPWFRAHECGGEAGSVVPAW